MGRNPWGYQPERRFVYPQNAINAAVECHAPKARLRSLACGMAFLSVFLGKAHAGKLEISVLAPSATSTAVKVQNVYMPATGGDEFYLDVRLINQSPYNLNFRSSTDFGYAVMGRNQVRFEMTANYSDYPGEVAPGATHVFSYRLPGSFPDPIKFVLRPKSDVYLGASPLIFVALPAVAVEKAGDEWASRVAARNITLGSSSKRLGRTSPGINETCSRSQQRRGKQNLKKDSTASISGENHSKPAHCGLPLTRASADARQEESDSARG